MASVFEQIFDHAMDAIIGRLADINQATLTYALTGTTLALSVVFNEQVGFVDDNLRALWLFDADDVTTELARGDYFVLNGQTQRWYVVDVRDDKAGGIEVRADAHIERT